MPILSNVRHVLRCTKPQALKAEKAAAKKFIAWPFIDNLFDFKKIMGPGKTLTDGPIPNGLNKKVAIIGAGAGGMCAAYELLKSGVIPDIFEAGTRVGGRAWSKHFTDETGKKVKAFAELGSMRVPPSQETFWAYAAEFGLKTGGTFPDPGKVQTRLYYENKGYEWAPNTPSPGPFKRIAEDFADWIDTLDQKLYPPFQKWQESPTPENLSALVNAWQFDFIEPYKGTSFYNAVAEAMPTWTSEDMNAFGALGVGSGGFGPLYQINMVELARIILLQWEDDQQMFPSGMEAMPDSFYQTKVNVPGKGCYSLKDLNTVKFNTKIESISYDTVKGNPIIKLNCGTQKEYDAVIVATTSRSMSYMGLTLPGRESEPVLDERTEEAIRNLHLTNSSKLFIRTKTKFWLDENGQPKENFPMTILTDELPRAAYVLDYPSTDNGVVLVSYTWEDDSIKLQSVPVKERFEILREILYRVAPEWVGKLNPENDEILNVDWQLEENYYGAFKLNFPGQEPNIHAAYFQFMSVLDEKTDRGVFLAGDSNSWAGGWTEGALQTGLNAATAVAKRLGAKLPVYNALTQDPTMYCYQKNVDRALSSMEEVEVKVSIESSSYTK